MLLPSAAGSNVRTGLWARSCAPSRGRDGAELPGGRKALQRDRGSRGHVQKGLRLLERHLREGASLAHIVELSFDYFVNSWTAQR
jgi:hypothetical protein